MARLLLVDDDRAFARVLARSLARRGFEVGVAHEAEQALALADEDMAGAIVDLQLGNASGLALIPALRACNPRMRILMLTGYAGIETAVAAIKLGADHYLAKPTTADDIVALMGGGTPAQQAEPRCASPMPLKRLQSEHIRRILSEHGGNISGAARALKMHRRTLQRKLARFL